MHDFSLTYHKMQTMGQQFFRLLPNLVIGLVIFVVFLFLAKLAKSLVGKFAWNKGKFPTQTLLLHNQTEPDDAERGQHREGWPPQLAANSGE